MQHMARPSSVDAYKIRMPYLAREGKVYKSLIVNSMSYFIPIVVLYILLYIVCPFYNESGYITREIKSTCYTKLSGIKKSIVLYHRNYIQNTRYPMRI